jgi:Na+:H+ antiporter, NhaA family
MKLSRLFTEFINSEKAGGLVLILCTIVSLLLANSSFQGSYLNIWSFEIAGHHLDHWVNDGLMTIFFLLVGLELEREIYAGELSEMKNALLPIFGAIGGMLVPAGIYLLFNYGKPSQSGSGIPMATDIAFALGVLALLGNRIPSSLKVFLTALAIIDDLGAILIIAFFYSQGLSFVHLGIALGIFAFLLLLNRLKVHILWPYLAGGIIMWYFMLQSGVHATISGVLLAFAVPFGDGGEKSPSYQLQHALHKPVAFIILPVFALANTCIMIPSNWLHDLGSPASKGIFMGLVLGKPIGVMLMSGLALLLGIANLPRDLTWKYLLGAGMLAGIGFTMSIFITLLAFSDPAFIAASKIAIVLSSLAAAIIGLVWLRIFLKPGPLEE